MSENERISFSGSKFFDFIDLERKEIDIVKWNESQKLGYDIGHDRAIWLWITRYRDNWRRGLRESGLY